MCVQPPSATRFRVGGPRLEKYPSDPRHWYERRVLATPDVEETAQTTRSAIVAVLTPVWDTYLKSAGERPLNGGRTVTGVSGCIYGVLGSGLTEICSFFTVWGEPHAGKLGKYRALGRKPRKLPEGEGGYLATPASAAENMWPTSSY